MECQKDATYRLAFRKKGGWHIKKIASSLDMISKSPAWCEWHAIVRAVQRNFAQRAMEKLYE